MPSIKNDAVTPDDIFNVGVKSLNEKVDRFQNSVTSKMNSELNSIKRVMAEKLSSIEQEAKNSIYNQNSEIEATIKKHNQDMAQMKREISTLVESKDVENTRRNTMMLNSLESVNRKLNNLNISFMENDNGDYIYYTNINGKTISTFMEKPKDKYIPDEVTLTYKNDRVSIKHSYDEKTLKIENDRLSAVGFLLNNGSYLSADKINNNLTSVTYETKSLTYKVDNIIKRLDNINGYLASNNFKKENPAQEQLTDFAISCISSAVDSDITREKIPNGAKIKNTFDNHIWVFNHITYNGLTTYKWEDFGSDNICIANNTGTLGLIAGSQEKYKGFVDIKGNLSINGLEEELKSISDAIKSLGNSMIQYINSVDAQLKKMENKIKELESK